jgi:hypothetical protein
MPEKWTHIPPESVAHLLAELVAHYLPESVAQLLAESVAHFDRNTQKPNAIRRTKHGKPACPSLQRIVLRSMTHRFPSRGSASSNVIP